MSEKRLSLKLKREIVKRFWDGKSVGDIAVELVDVFGFFSNAPDVDGIEQVIRDYGNKKFSLTPRKKK